MRKQEIKRVISVRVTDEEMEDLQQLMELTNGNATGILRKALALFSAQWTATERQALAGSAGAISDLDH